MSDNNNVNTLSVNKLRYLFESIERDIKELKRILPDIEAITKKNYKEIPGLMGTFDGFYLVPAEGAKVEVPQNYSAKSLLVYGDTLKMIEEDGKKLFKQIAKVERKQIEGVINKKDGKWHILADSGSYRVNDACVDFNKLQIGDKVKALIPQDNLGAPFATLDVAPHKDEKPVSAPTPKEFVDRISVAKPLTKPKTASSKPRAEKKVVDKPVERVEKKEEAIKPVKKSAVLDEDDLR